MADAMQGKGIGPQIIRHNPSPLYHCSQTFCKKYIDLYPLTSDTTSFFNFDP